MADNRMEHKGYVGELCVDVEAGVIRGTVAVGRDTVTFQGRTVEEARLAFRESVDDYLDFCAATAQEPEPATDRDDRTLAILEDACRAALIFCPPFNAKSRGEWLRITGSAEFSTSILRPLLMRALDQSRRRRDPREVG